MDELTFDSGKSWTEYLNAVSKNRDRFEEVYTSYLPSADDLDAFQSVNSLRILAIVEDWCPDVYHTLGIIAKLSDFIPEVQLRIFERDSRPEIMEQFLTGGKRRIPVYALFDASLREVCRWSGRNREADAWVDEFRRGREYGDIPDDELLAFREEFDRRYESGYRRANLEELKSAIRAAVRADD